MPRARRIVLPLALLSALAPAAACAGDLTVDDVTQLAPVLDSADPAYRSLHVEGYVDLSPKLQGVTFRAVYRAPDRYAMAICDLRDETPIWFVADDQAVFYDPIRSVAFYLTSAKGQFAIFQHDDAIRLEFNFTSSSDEQPGVRFDARSLLMAESSARQLHRHENGAYTFRATSLRGNPLQAVIDPAYSFPLTRIELIAKDVAEPFFVINRLSVNAAVDDNQFAFPDVDALRKVVKVEELPKDHTQAALICANLKWQHATRARGALFDSTLRAKFPAIDWERARQNDRRFSATWRQLLAQKQSETSPDAAPAAADARPHAD